ncbi:putative SWIRM domain family protein [Phytophthora infestans]|uniref:Putative SWIRM domain family protein n=1 Tax=Phytophthora infestans TaxID=4787 RepID=A0A833SFE9_PHYIN|nr:putative SWIRM domain family protein [Phytophthora infestans]
MAIVQAKRVKPDPTVEDTPHVKEREIPKWNCNQIRTKIRNFLATKELTRSAFLGLLHIEPTDFREFMRLTGGEVNSTYIGATIFFDRYEKREKEKLKAMEPKDRKRKAAEQKEVRTKRSKDGAEFLKRIEEVELPDIDDDGTVPVFDDCDDIRNKINCFLGEGIVTKAAFLRALGDVNSNSLRSYMNLRRGASSGASNVVYRTAYVFFEKKRILEGKPKSVKRLANEDLQGPDGFPLDHSPNWHFIEKVLNGY